MALTLGGTYLFFCTGHFCEFAGLQYTAGAWRIRFQWHRPNQHVLLVASGCVVANPSS